MPESRPLAILATGGGHCLTCGEGKSERLHGYRRVLTLHVLRDLSDNGCLSTKAIHCKKILKVLLSPAGMSLTKLYLAENNLIFPGQREFG